MMSVIQNVAKTLKMVLCSSRAMVFHKNEDRNICDHTVFQDVSHDTTSDPHPWRWTVPFSKNVAENRKFVRYKCAGITTIFFQAQHRKFSSQFLI